MGELWVLAVLCRHELWSSSWDVAVDVGTDTLTWILLYLFSALSLTLSAPVLTPFSVPSLGFYCLHLTTARAAPGTRQTQLLYTLHCYTDPSHKLLLSCFLVHPLMQPLPCLMFSTCTLFIYLAWALSVECHEKYNRRSPVPVAHSVRLAVDVYIRFLMLNSFCHTVYSHANKQPATVPNNIRSSYSLQCSFIRKLD